MAGFFNIVKHYLPAVSAIYDMTVGFREDAAKPNLMNILFGRATQGEVYVRWVTYKLQPYRIPEDFKWAADLYGFGFDGRDFLYG